MIVRLFLVYIPIIESILVELVLQSVICKVCAMSSFTLDAIHACQKVMRIPDYNFSQNIILLSSQYAHSIIASSSPQN